MKLHAKSLQLASERLAELEVSEAGMLGKTS